MKLIDTNGREGNPETLRSLPNLAVFPGSFNPLHIGHKKIHELLSDQGYRVVFEISKSRFRKEPYSEEQLAALISQFRGFAPVLVTDAPLFSQKQEALSRFDPCWVMGYDTARRWIDENRKLDQQEQKQIEEMKVIFIGRLSDGVYHNPEDLLDGSERYHCRIFHLYCDISSTQIREARTSDD